MSYTNGDKIVTIGKGKYDNGKIIGEVVISGNTVKCAGIINVTPKSGTIVAAGSTVVTVDNQILHYGDTTEQITINYNSNPVSISFHQTDNTMYYVTIGLISICAWYFLF